MAGTPPARKSPAEPSSSSGVSLAVPDATDSVVHHETALSPRPRVPDRTLVVRFGRVGDMLVVTPVLRALRRAH
ncbi:MAG: hypothetical protein L0271_19980, partial [Gemmatimonadetes bacterium]|nr:hypothetical protein [Gemmatimonadota bacterium]